jgi:hypothetical protein
VLGDVHQRVLDHQPDDLAPYDRNAVAVRLFLDEREDTLDGRAPRIDEVHRDLDDAALLELEPERLHIAQPARLEADRLRDPLRDLDVLRAEIDVEREQRHPRAHGDRARARVDHGRTEIGSAIGIRPDLARQAFVFSPPNVGQVLPGRTRGGRFVEIDRNLKLRADSLPRPPGQLHAPLQLGRSDRNERQHVGRPHAGVLSSMTAQVDQLGRLLDALHRRLNHGLSLPYKGDHAPVVVGVHFLVQEPDGPIARNFGSDGPNYR